VVSVFFIYVLCYANKLLLLNSNFTCNATVVSLVVQQLDHL